MVVAPPADNEPQLEAGTFEDGEAQTRRRRGAEPAPSRPPPSWVRPAGPRRRLARAAARGRRRPPHSPRARRRSPLLQWRARGAPARLKLEAAARARVPHQPPRLPRAPPRSPPGTRRRRRRAAPPGLGRSGSAEAARDQPAHAFWHGTAGRSGRAPGRTSPAAPAASLTARAAGARGEGRPRPAGRAPPGVVYAPRQQRAEPGGRDSWLHRRAAILARAHFMFRVSLEKYLHVHQTYGRCRAWKKQLHPRR